MLHFYQFIKKNPPDIEPSPFHQKLKQLEATKSENDGSTNPLSCFIKASS